MRLHGIRDGEAGTYEGGREESRMDRGRYVERLISSYRRYYDIIPAASAAAFNALRAESTAKKTAGEAPQQAEPVSAERLEGPAGLICRCDFTVRNAQYVLLKKNELWSAESREHCYIFSVPLLTEEIYRSLERYVYEEGMKLVHPGKGHMCTTLTLLVVCDRSEPGAEKLLRKCRLHKSFRFSLDGWMDFHTGLMAMESGKAAANFGGHDNLKLLKQLIR